MDEKLSKALNGFTESNGGLNLSDLKNELTNIHPNDGEFILKATRKDIIEKYNGGHVFVLIGFQGSTKSTYAQKLSQEYNAIILSRDDLGGKIIDMIPLIEKYRSEGKSVIVDNTNLTHEIQNYYEKFNPKFIYFNTTIEDCQIRILSRMHQKYGTIFMTGKLPTSFEKDPHVFPPAVLFNARKILELPTEYKTIKVEKPFITGKHKGLFLDIDGTLRKTDHLVNKYPLEPEEVIPAFDLDKMKEKLGKYIKDGYILVGISNQSGISKKIITAEKVELCMKATLDMLSLDFPILYCPHQSVPISCYCRKPQVGNLLKACLDYDISPVSSLFIGDRTTDKTCATRMSIKYINADVFFA